MVDHDPERWIADNGDKSRCEKCQVAEGSWTQMRDLLLLTLARIEGVE